MDVFGNLKKKIHFRASARIELDFVLKFKAYNLISGNENARGQFSILQK